MSSRTTQKKKVRYSSKSPERLVFERVDESDKQLVWEKSKKSLRDLISEELREEFDKEYNKYRDSPFEFKSISEIKNMSPTKKETYLSEYFDYTKKLKDYIKANLQSKSEARDIDNNKRQSQKEEHYKTVGMSVEGGIKPKKSAGAGGGRSRSRSKTPSNVAEFRPSEPAEREIEWPPETQTGITGFFSSLFNGKRRGGRRKRKNRTRKH